MSYVTTRDGTNIFYKDWGPKDAQPIVFHHGWPLSSDDWDAQMLFFLADGYRVVAHDRRGHGRSDQVSGGHDMATYAADAAAVAEQLDLPENAVRVIAPDVGGGFGTKLFTYREYALVVLAADSILFECKAGPYRPVGEGELAPWAPREGEPGVAAYQVWMRAQFA